ncbi:hypothetical protein BJY00DRAFT_282206 [Aspergillus carlsbadensis]|nr:hypothetical protein BJY00DRAFT_282206 [Aspergillus carlsbadensis]
MLSRVTWSRLPRARCSGHILLSTAGQQQHVLVLQPSQFCLSSCFTSCVVNTRSQIDWMNSPLPTTSNTRLDAADAASSLSRQ